MKRKKYRSIHKALNYNWLNMKTEIDKLEYLRSVQGFIGDAIQEFTNEELVHEVRVFSGELVIGKKYIRVNTNLKPVTREIFTFLGDSHLSRQFNYKRKNRFIDADFAADSGFYYDYGLMPEPNSPHNWNEGVYTVEAEEEPDTFTPPKPGTVRIHNAKVEWACRVFKDDLISGEEYLRFYSEYKEPERFTYIQFISQEQFLCLEINGKYATRFYSDYGLAPYENPTRWHHSAYTTKANKHSCNTYKHKYLNK